MSAPKIITFELDDYEGRVTKNCIASIHADADQLQRVLKIAAMQPSARPRDFMANMRWPEQELRYQSVDLLFYADNSLRFCRVRNNGTLRTVRVPLDTVRIIAESPFGQRFHIIGVTEKFQSRVFKIVESRFTWQYHQGIAEESETPASGW